MGIRVKKCFFIRHLRTVWRRIYAANVTIKPTQDYDYYRHLFYSFYAKHFLTRWRIVFFYVNDDINECIIPFVINQKKRVIKGLSNFGRLDYEDIVSSTNDSTFVRRSLETVLDDYRGYRLDLVNINESSALFQSLGQRMELREKCVSIELAGCFDEFMLRLSKHQRQNIRTAYNRIQKRSFNYNLVQYDENKKIPHHLWMSCQQIYERRHNETGSFLRKWVDRQLNPYTHILHSIKGWRVLVLFHGSTPIAYMGGIFSERQGCFYVPRLCIDPDFSEYSPGIILLNETIRSFIGEGVKCLDLMLGDEPYKIAMGGETHNNYEIKCCVKDLFD